MHLLKLHVKLKTNLLKKVGKPIEMHQYLLMAKLNTRNVDIYNFSDVGNIVVGVVGTIIRSLSFLLPK